MEFRVDRSVILPAIQVVSRIIPGKPAFEVLKGICFRAGEGVVELTATDLDTTIQRRVPVDVVEPGGAVIPARILAKILSYLPEGGVSISSDGHGAIVQSQRSKVEMPAFPQEEFPFVEPENKGHMLILDASFRRAFQSVCYAASRMPDRVINNVLIEVKPGMITLVATDGYRLASCEVPADFAAEFSVLVPVKILREAVRQVNKESSVAVWFNLADGAAWAVFEADGLRIVGRLPEGRYPDYRCAFPNGQEELCVVKGNASDLVATAKKALVFSDNSGYLVFTVKDGSLIVESEGEGCRLEECLDGFAVAGHDTVLGFNARYVLEALRPIGSGPVEIAFYDRDPCYCGRAVVKNGSYKALVMPVSIP